MMGQLIFVSEFVPESFRTHRKKTLDQEHTMAAIGSLVFCTDCGNLLPSTKGTERNVLSCECCGAENRGLFAPAKQCPPSISNAHLCRYRLQVHCHANEAVRLPLLPEAEASVKRPSRRETQHPNRQHQPGIMPSLCPRKRQVHQRAAAWCR